jgi:hypothetical protein
MPLLRNNGRDTCSTPSAPSTSGVKGGHARKPREQSGTVTFVQNYAKEPGGDVNQNAQLTAPAMLLDAVCDWQWSKTEQLVVG